MTKNHVKTVPDNIDKRDSFSLPTPQTFEFGEYSYTIKPFNILQKKRWNKLLKQRENLSMEYWTKNDLGNVYAEIRKILTVEYGGELDDAKRNDIHEAEFDRLSDEDKVRFMALSAHLADSRSYAFEEMAYEDMFNLFCECVSTNRDGEEKPLTSTYLMYSVPWEEMCFISEKVDDTNSLTAFEVLGLR